MIPPYIAPLRMSSDRADIQKEIEEYRSNISKSIQILEESLRPQSRKKQFVVVISIIVTIVIIISLASLKNVQTKKNLKLNNYISKLQQQRIKEFEYNSKLILESDNLIQALKWNDYNQMCKIINEKLFMLADKLRNTENLDKDDIKYCILVAIGASYKQQAQLLNISEKSIPRKKSDIGKKLHVSMKNFRPLLIKMACSDVSMVDI